MKTVQQTNTECRCKWEEMVSQNHGWEKKKKALFLNYYFTEHVFKYLTKSVK